MASDNSSSSFFSILQGDYAVWQSQVLLSVFYDELSARKEIIPPQSFRSLINEKVKIPDRVQDSQDILHELAANLLQSAELPPKENVETFLSAYENFQNALQRLDQDSLLADNGIDSQTGLRSSVVMLPELERELERRARRGQPFCIVLSRIDGEVARKTPENIALAVQCIEKTIRSFDDAYVTDDGEFLSSLKHSDDKGGIKFVARLNEALKGKEGVQFTMSSFVAEPLPGDDMNQLISNIKIDLDRLAKEEKGMAGQYEDISPLARYVQSLKDEKKE